VGVVSSPCPQPRHACDVKGNRRWYRFLVLHVQQLLFLASLLYQRECGTRRPDAHLRSLAGRIGQRWREAQCACQLRVHGAPPKHHLRHDDKRVGQQPARAGGKLEGARGTVPGVAGSPRTGSCQARERERATSSSNITIGWRERTGGGGGRGDWKIEWNVLPRSG
jgi:hypothetical protein